VSGTALVALAAFLWGGALIVAGGALVIKR
jgi:hypothetical protein